jgi:hypothetical protein
MNEKEANIDLLFRNGLKDFEVIPPPGVWDGIHSAVKIKSRQYIFLRVAAAIAVILTLSFFTYKWSQQNSIEPGGSEISFNVPDYSPVFSRQMDEPQFIPAKKSNHIQNDSNILIASDTQAQDMSDAETAVSPDQILNIQGTRSLYLTKKEINGNFFLLPPNKSKESFDNINYPGLTYSQDVMPVKPMNRWSIAAMASPTYYSSFNSGNDAFSKQLNASEQPLVSYSGGVAFSYKISKRFTIQSGLYYSTLGQKVEGISSFDGFQKYEYTKGGPNFEVPTTNGTIYTSNPDVFLASDGNNRVLTAYTKDVFDPKKASLQPVNSSLDQNFSYLEFPVILKYKIVDRTLGINLIGGLSYNVLVNNTVSTTSVDGTRYSIGKTDGLNPLTLSSSLGMGMEYNFSSKLSLNLEPTFRYYLNPFSVTSGSFIHPYSFGIFSGVSYKF